ncbi:MAG: hypothetical protein ACLVEZ_05970 [Mediterraneibacter faecis]
MDDAPTSEFFNIMMNKMGGLINKAAKTKKATAIAEIMSDIFDIPGYNYASSRYKIDAKIILNRQQPVPKPFHRLFTITGSL